MTKHPTGRGTCLILGGAKCVWDDIDKLEDIMGEPWPGVVIVVNAMGYAPGHNGRIWDRPVHHWATLHAEKMAGWKRIRRDAGLPGGYQTWSSVRRTVVDHHFTGLTGGSSGLYGWHVGVNGLRHPRGVLCGIPMDGSQNSFSGKEWKQHRRYLRGWQRDMKTLDGRTKSFSGWTRSVFGAPTMDWISLVPQA